MTKQEQKDKAYAEYNAIIEPANKECRAIIEPAYAEYNAIIEQAYAEYNAIREPAYKEYQAIEKQAFKEYQAKCSEIDGKEIKIICAAIKMMNGDIIRGHRHHNCIRTVRDIPRMKEMQLSEQGFMTSNNEFVDREEAYRIFLGSGEISCDEERSPMSKRSKLYSEDLY